MIPHIDEMSEPPVVGRFYMVPTVTAAWQPWDGSWKKSVWPVLGSKHNDIDYLAFKPVHFHVDARFLPARVWDYLGDPRRLVAGSVICETDRYGDPLHDLVVTYRKLLCRRPSIGHIATGGAAKPDGPWPKLHDAYQAKRCPKGPQGWICPHKGLPLGSIQPDSDGTIVCPLHGLRIDGASGIVVPTVQILGESA